MTNEEKINLIGQKILLLSNNLDKYQNELQQLKQQLEILQQGNIKQQNIVPPVVKVSEQKIDTSTPLSVTNEIKKEIPDTSTTLNVTKEIKVEEIPVIKIPETIVPPIQQQYIPPTPPKPKSDFNFEAFVGGKLITIIGIVILVIGLGIGVKYAIDNDMLGPLARIVLAYVAGGILLFIAFRLKEKYKAFSAVLLSGGMASLYFTTFIAYSLYGMFGQIPAFAIMVVFTMFTVFAATIYNLQVIGIIGLVGAYAVPMLLSDGSGKIEVMFSYMVIVNIGILVLSFKKYWQLLNHLAFGFTWLIFLAWFGQKFDYQIHTVLSLTFAFLFFIIFYLSNMAYKIMKQEKFGVMDVIRIVSNSFIFFGLGYATLNHDSTSDYLGIFTVANALVHFVFAYIVFKNKLLDRKLFYLLIALVLSFITIAVPVQLEGNWVTLFWAAEAVLLFSIGRYKAVRFYEWLGYIMILLAILSLMHDWQIVDSLDYSFIYFYKSWTPVANIYCFTSLFVCAAIAAMIYVHHKKELTEEVHKKFSIYQIVEYLLPVTLLLLIYVTFCKEIAIHFKLLYENSLIQVPSKGEWDPVGYLVPHYDSSFQHLKIISYAIYNLVYVSIFSVLAVYKLKSNAIRWAAFGLNIFVAIFFITIGLVQLSKLDESLHYREITDYYTTSAFTMNVRYLCFTLFALLLFINHKILRTDTFNKFAISKFYVGCIMHFFILIVLSNELVHLQTNHNAEYDYYGNNTVYKLGFTVLWGVYSFIMIAVGMYKKNKIMRISAISLFGITIVKLLIFDTWNLSTGYKVIAYILLGVILLVVSFLYQKFKAFIFGDDTN